ncbi:MAG: aspartate aminotransferase family protein [Saprospiraceae bacterium]|nr:aspartate aminotransferase family protein [Saprospiraceae bacterium]MCF8249318.1 aspartate aminotransferase family protein [Saprospiraceae bacterium]MCF8279739.1 aspartate aminotransferase family protein [Bacteroidales bacterium]MCF8311405.1 aspartate aminotransferase family protein [Saprospiraceae bacterium]MCF8439937.1 aspartate aminotransferase family protein [Saprospiraceae bacterium]
MKKRALNILPENSRPPAEILADMQAAKSTDTAWKEGKTWTLQYFIDEEHNELLKAAQNLYFSENYINPFLFKSILKMEKEVVGMAADLLHGDENTVGTMTSGGTESVLLAMYACREWAKKHRPSIKTPEIVAPRTIHPAFDKAAHYFGLSLRKAKVHENMAANVAAMEQLITKNTILLAASAPSFAHGILDPIPAIGQLAEKHNLLFHVDACVGGFMLPWVERLGENLPEWDFRVPSVTSMSCDLHKFGFAAKGASIVLYRNTQLFENQIFINTEYSGGIFATASLLGTRPGGTIAAAWAGFQHLGQAGYLKNAREMLAAFDQLRAGIEALPELQIIGEPCMNMLAFFTKNNQPDIYAVADFMEEKGWVVDRQQLPPSIHLTVFPYNIPVIPNYLVNLEAAVAWANAHPEASGEGNAALYGIMARIPLRGMVKENVRKVFVGAYANGNESGTSDFAEQKQATPRWMGWLSRLLAWWKN